jgi:uncharacterized protein
MTDTEAPRPFRVLPAVGPDNEHFWTGGAEGELRFLRCTACRCWIHPPSPVCPRCLSTELAVEAASGRATVFTYTINWQPWIPTFDPPYVVAIVALPEQEDLRLTTNIVGCEPDDVVIGMEVEVDFLEYDDVWLPLFRPVAPPASPAGGGAAS